MHRSYRIKIKYSKVNIAYEMHRQYKSESVCSLLLIVIPSPAPLFANFTTKTPLLGIIDSAHNTLNVSLVVSFDKCNNIVSIAYFISST